MTSKNKLLSSRYEGSIGELFYRSCIADRSFVPQDDRKIGYVMGRYEASVRELFYRSCIADRCFVPQHDRGIICHPSTGSGDRPMHLENRTLYG